MAARLPQDVDQQRRRVVSRCRRRVRFMAETCAERVGKMLERNCGIRFQNGTRYHQSFHGVPRRFRKIRRAQPARPGQRAGKSGGPQRFCQCPCRRRIQPEQNGVRMILQDLFAEPSRVRERRFHFNNFLDGAIAVGRGFVEVAGRFASGAFVRNHGNPMARRNAGEQHLRLLEGARNDARHPGHARLADGRVGAQGDHRHGGAAGDLQHQVRGRAVRRRNQAQRAVVGGHPGGFDAIRAPLAGASANDEADLRFRRLIGQLHAERCAVAEAGGGGFLRRHEQADDEVGVVGGGFSRVQARRTRHQGDGDHGKTRVMSVPKVHAEIWRTFHLLAKRQRAGALQDTSRFSSIIVSRTASWTAAALRRFSQSISNCANVKRAAIESMNYFAAVWAGLAFGGGK